jgi:hypothetical protein
VRARKKPIEVDVAPIGELIDAARNDWKALPGWVRDAYDRGDVIFERDQITIATLEGQMRGRREDWLIKGVLGELYPCAGHIFYQTFDLVTDADLVTG